LMSNIMTFLPTCVIARATGHGPRNVQHQQFREWRAV
jgi:hypothetical protein